MRGPRVERLRRELRLGHGGRRERRRARGRRERRARARLDRRERRRMIELTQIFLPMQTHSW